MKWFIKCLQNYANFSGRARRAEYWYFVLFVVIIAIIARLSDMAISGGGYGSTWITGTLQLALLLPSLAVGVRRLHDIGKSGKNLMWFIIAEIVWFIALMITGLAAIPVLISGGNLADISVSFLVILFGGMLVLLIWSIVFIVWYCMPGDKGENKYGPDPKALAE